MFDVEGPAAPPATLLFKASRRVIGVCRRSYTQDLGTLGLLRTLDSKNGGSSRIRSIRFFFGRLDLDWFFEGLGGFSLDLDGFSSDLDGFSSDDWILDLDLDFGRFT